MSEIPQSGELEPAPAAGIPTPAPAVGNPPADNSGSKPVGPAAANNLTPEEQMERFAKELQENDWGHQPC